MNFTITFFFSALILCAPCLSAAALTFESNASCTAGTTVVTGSDSCLAKSGFTFAGAEAKTQPLAFGEVSLDVSVVMEGNGNHASVSARAGFSDLFLIYGQPAGTPAMLEMTASVYAGTDHDLIDAIRIAGVSVSVRSGFGGDMTLILPFRFGDVLDFAVLFDLAVAAEDCEYGCPAIASRSAGLALQRFRVLNTLGGELTGFKFHSESETPYNFVGGEFRDPSAVPEPATCALTLIALMAAGLWRKWSLAG